MVLAGRPLEHVAINAAGAVDSNARPRLALALIFLVVVVNLADRQIINILAQDIKADLGLSDGQLGLLTGLSFASVYALVSLPLAWLADRMNRAKIVAVMLAFWSLCTVACGASAGFAGLFLARMGVGAGEGGAQAACTALARDLFPSRGTTALAVAMAGNPVGSFVGFLVGGAAAGAWGWRAAFVLAGVPGLLLAAVVWSKVLDPRPTTAAPLVGRRFAGDVLAILARPRIATLTVAVSASLLVLYATGAWLPPFLIRTHGFTTAEMGSYGALATGICGGLGTATGFLCDRFGARVRLVELKFMILVSLAVVPFALATVGAHGIAAALVGYGLLNFVAFAGLAPLTRLIQDTVEPGERALAFAICGGIGLLFSLGVGVPLIGWASDLLEPTFGVRSLGVALGCALPLAAAIAIAGYAWLLRADVVGQSTG